MSTGMEAVVVTNPEIMLAKKWSMMPSLTKPKKIDIFSVINW
jgi:hypothetical protein